MIDKIGKWNCKIGIFLNNWVNELHSVLLWGQVLKKSDYLRKIDLANGHVFSDLEQELDVPLDALVCQGLELLLAHASWESLRWFSFFLLLRWACCVLWCRQRREFLSFCLVSVIFCSQWSSVRGVILRALFWRRGLFFNWYCPHIRYPDYVGHVVPGYLQEHITQLPYVRLAQVLLQVSVRLPVGPTPVWALAHLTHNRALELAPLVVVLGLLYEQLGEEKHPQKLVDVRRNLVWLKATVPLQRSRSAWQVHDQRRDQVSLDAFKEKPEDFPYVLVNHFR